MRSQSAIAVPATTTLTRAITVAAGPFAPGHLGELTQVIPFDLVDAILAETGRVQARLRILPSRVGVYLVLAMGLFDRVGLRGVFDRLTAGLTGLLPLACPSEKALRDLRRRLGPEPFKALFQVLARPLARPDTPGSCYRHWTTVAFDGCSSTRVPDHERNRGWLGKITHSHGPAGYPSVMLMALVETGTRALLGAALGPVTTGERAYATGLAPLLGPRHLVLHDQGLDGTRFLHTLAGTGAQILGRWHGPTLQAILHTHPPSPDMDHR